MSHVAPPLSIVLLASIADFPIHALVAPSGDTIILSQDNRVSTLINTPEIIQSVLTQYDRFIIDNESSFILFHEVQEELTEDDISPKQHVDLIDDSLIILRSILQYEALVEDLKIQNSKRKIPKELDSSFTMKQAIKHAILIDKLMLDLSANIERLQVQTISEK